MSINSIDTNYVTQKSEASKTNVSEEMTKESIFGDNDSKVKTNAQELSNEVDENSSETDAYETDSDFDFGTDFANRIKYTLTTPLTRWAQSNSTDSDFDFGTDFSNRIKYTLTTPAMSLGQSISTKIGNKIKDIFNKDEASSDAGTPAMRLGQSIGTKIGNKIKDIFNKDDNQ